HTGAVIGTALLPTFTRLTTELSNWLSKMNSSGRLQRDLRAIVSDLGDVFHTLGGAISFVDKVTGSFANTLKLLIGIRLGFLITGWISGLNKLVGSWIAVEGAAT